MHDNQVGIGGAPNRATTLPTDAAGRKQTPIATGVLDYFPDALAAVARVSYLGNEQHNPGQPLHWARGKSAEEADTMIRHFLQRGTFDTDGARHSAKMVWRAAALLQKEIEADVERGLSLGMALEQSRQFAFTGIDPRNAVAKVEFHNAGVPCTLPAHRGATLKGKHDAPRTKD